MVVAKPLAILCVEDLPGVRQARAFRHRCAEATAAISRTDRVREKVREAALATVAAAAAAYRATAWLDARNRLDACEQARVETMAALYRLYSAGMVPAFRFDEAAYASAELKLTLAMVAMDMRERRIGWVS